MLSVRTCVGNLCIKRQMHGNAEIIQNCKEIRNRNPRNLERLRIARKPSGYLLEKSKTPYWHKLVVKPAQRFVVAEIHHFENGPVITASTEEWSLKSQLYSTKDVSAYINLGHVLAQRCLQCGICEMYFGNASSSKMKSLVAVMKTVGIKEPPRYIHRYNASVYRDEKPWETFE